MSFPTLPRILELHSIDDRELLSRVVATLKNFLVKERPDLAQTYSEADIEAYFRSESAPLSTPVFPAPELGTDVVGQRLISTEGVGARDKWAWALFAFLSCYLMRVFRTANEAIYRTKFASLVDLVRSDLSDFLGMENFISILATSFREYVASMDILALQPDSRIAEFFPDWGMGNKAVLMINEKTGKTLGIWGKEDVFLLIDPYSGDLLHIYTVTSQHILDKAIFHFWGEIDPGGDVYLEITFQQKKT